MDVDGRIGKRGEHVPVNVTDIVADQGRFGHTQTNLAVFLLLARVPPMTWDGMNQDVMHFVIMEEHLTVTLVDVLLDFTVHVVDFKSTVGIQDQLTTETFMTQHILMEQPYRIPVMAATC